jgi:hypothetical protein
VGRQDSPVTLVEPGHHGPPWSVKAASRSADVRKRPGWILNLFAT